MNAKHRTCGHAHMGRQQRDPTQGLSGLRASQALQFHAVKACAHACNNPTERGTMEVVDIIHLTGEVARNTVQTKITVKVICALLQDMTTMVKRKAALGRSGAGLSAGALRPPRRDRIALGYITNRPLAGQGWTPIQQCIDGDTNERP